MSDCNFKKEVCFGASFKKDGKCDVLEVKGKPVSCQGFGEYPENGIIKKCSFYKTKAEFQKGFCIKI